MRTSHALAVLSRACASLCETPSHPEHIVAETPGLDHALLQDLLWPNGLYPHHWPRPDSWEWEFEGIWLQSRQEEAIHVHPCDPKILDGKGFDHLEFWPFECLVEVSYCSNIQGGSFSSNDEPLAS